MSRRRRIPLFAEALLTFAFVFASTAPLAAQRRRERPQRQIGWGSFQAGYAWLDVDALNESLSGAGYPSLEGTFRTLGGAGFGTHGRVVIGGEGAALLGSKETTTDGSLEIAPGGGYGLFRVGYLALRRGGLDVVPMVGVGGGGMSLDIRGRSAPTFEDVLNDPARSSHLSNGMFLLDAGMAVNYRIHIENREERDSEGGLLVGIQAGYTFAPGNPSWTLDGINSVGGGPTLRVNAAYVKISLGGWGQPEEEDSRP